MASLYHRGGCRAHATKLRVLLLTIQFVAIQSPHHAKGELVGFGFCIGPEDIVAHFVIHHVDPTTLRLVFSAVQTTPPLDSSDGKNGTERQRPF
jgi:hypothetical protein